MRTLLRELITFGKTIYYLLGFNISIPLRIKSVLSGAVIVSMFSWFSTILVLKKRTLFRWIFYFGGFGIITCQNEFSVPNKKSSERVEKPEQPEEKPKQIKERKPKPDGAKYRLKSKSVDASTQSSQIFENNAYVSYICETSQFISKEIAIWLQKEQYL